jgi:hypothetical protein
MQGDYNFWADLLDTYQSLSDWIKALWLLVPPAFVLGLVAILRRPAMAEAIGQEPQGLVYSVYRSPQGTLVLHRPTDEVTDRSISPSPGTGDVPAEAAPSSRG